MKPTTMINKPRVGHPAKEGLRLTPAAITKNNGLPPRVGHPAKEGLRLLLVFL